jgi:hypothetical protein
MLLFDGQVNNVMVELHKTFDHVLPWIETTDPPHHRRDRKEVKRFPPPCCWERCGDGAGTRQNYSNNRLSCHHGTTSMGHTNRSPNKAAKSG